MCSQQDDEWERFHVDDLMNSHVDPKANDKFEKWPNKKHGQCSEATTTREKVHDCLGMAFEFEDKKVKINMTDQLKNMLNEFPIKFKENDKKTTPASSNSFNLDNSVMSDMSQ